MWAHKFVGVMFNQKVHITHTLLSVLLPLLMALWTLSRTTKVSWYQKKHSPTHLSWSSIIPYECQYISTKKLISTKKALHMWSDVTVICGYNMISVVWQCGIISEVKQ